MWSRYLHRGCLFYESNEFESNTFYFVTPLSSVVLSPYLVWGFFGIIGISHIPYRLATSLISRGPMADTKHSQKSVCKTEGNGGWEIDLLDLQGHEY